ncbi:PEP-CTERM sorting domain-containing protein [Rhodopirellula europaea]|uniref:PEP-CTERM sorting domain-containing protein n=1 Tax=Rhodopirellula europaea TaxID=1263866 RepID=UPI001F1D63FA|nr:PEP-CTERM sorting domain-containing protein [Rhodopirellula europaea]
MTMKMVEYFKIGVVAFIAKRLLYIWGVSLLSLGGVVDAAAVTRTVEFNDGVDFDVDGDQIISEEGEYVLDGMRFSVSVGDFSYPQNDSNFHWSLQGETSTSLGSQAGTRAFSIEVADPSLSPTFDMLSITIIGFSTAGTSNKNVTVEFTGEKADPMDNVTLITSPFDAGDRNPTNPLVVSFGSEFEGLTRLSWNQGGTAMAHQFDNVTFRVTAVPEPGTFLAMIALTTMGFVTRGRRWIVKRLQVV